MSFFSSCGIKNYGSASIEYYTCVDMDRLLFRFRERILVAIELLKQSYKDASHAARGGRRGGNYCRKPFVQDINLWFSNTIIM